MFTPRRIILVRHGETTGSSSTRLHGSSDVPLSEQGRDQARDLARALMREPLDLVVSSPLRRAYEAAWIVGGEKPVRLEPDFREIHFGRWEGLTKEEIKARDPISYDDWQNGVVGFEYPGGEARAAFEERVGRGLARLLAEPARNVLVVTHKGVIRTILRDLTGEKLDRELPRLGERIELTREIDGIWFRGRHPSSPLPTG